jgi:hypothetical protein
VKWVERTPHCLHVCNVNPTTTNRPSIPFSLNRPASVDHKKRCPRIGKDVRPNHEMELRISARSATFRRPEYMNWRKAVYRKNSIPQVQENHRSSIAALPANNNPMQECPQLSMAARFSSAEMNPDQSTPFKARRESLEWISLNRNHSESLYTRGSAQMIQIPTGSTGKSSLALEMSYHLSEKADLGKQIERILEQDRKILTSREHKGRTRMKRKE